MNKTWQETPSGLKRARGIDIAFDGTPGEHNSITDIPGLEIGYETLIEDREGSALRTGVTAHHAVIKWMNENFADSLADFGSPVVLETYDGILSDIDAQAITTEHVYNALNDAQAGALGVASR